LREDKEIGTPIVCVAYLREEREKNNPVQT